MVSQYNYLLKIVYSYDEYIQYFSYELVCIFANLLPTLLVRKPRALIVVA